MTDFKEVPEELTEAMHATFTVSDETDKRHRVWGAVRLESSGYSIEDACSMSQVTVMDYYRLRHTYPLPDDFE